jgi:glycosyltransferase involved in cell wall biosynthesis
MRRDIAAWLPHFDLFVLPSDWEGVSKALLEAMACGLPVIASAVGGTPEVVVNGTSGLLVPPRDVQALAAAIDLLLADSQQRAAMGQAARLRAGQEFSLEMTVARLSSLYNQLLEEEGKAL